MDAYIRAHPLGSPIHGWTYLPYHASICLQGEGTASLLQKLLPSDVISLAPGQVQLSFIANIKGRLVAQFWLYHHPENLNQFYFFAPIDNLMNLKLFLKPYIQFSACQISDILETYRVCVEFNQPHELNPKISICLQKDIEKHITHPTHNLLPHEIWDYYCIDAKIPEIYLSTSRTLLAHHIRLHELGTIALRKGCYLGQEVIARTHHLGKISRQLMSLTSQVPLPQVIPGQILATQAGQKAGIVVRKLDANGQSFILACIENKAMDEKKYVIHLSSEQLAYVYTNL